MDNFSIDVTAEGATTLRELFNIAFRHNCAGDRVTHWSVRHLCTPTNPAAKPAWVDAPGDGTTPVLVLYWHAPERGDHTAFPWPHDVEAATRCAWGWLENQDFGEQPDHDGDNGQGFRVFVDPWGQVAGSSYAVVGVTLAWAMYGK